jgi:hypothetical protein
MHRTRARQSDFRDLRAHSNNKSRATRRISRGLALLAIHAWLICGSFAALPSEATADDSLAAKSLDEQVQDIKSDVLAIAAEINNLEERLLYPSNTQIAVFMAVEEGDPLAIDAAHISIDGEFVAHHIYSFKELEALQRGGVQRIYTGNVPTGEHELEVTISGKRTGGRSFELVERFAFEKQVDPKLVGITLGAGIAGSTTVEIEDW